MSGSDVPSVLIVESLPLCRDGLLRLLVKGLRVNIVATANTLSDGLRYLEAYWPDLAIIDCDTQDGDVLEALDRVRQASPHTVLVLTSIGFSDDDEAGARHAGVHACVPKSAETRDIAKSLASALAQVRGSRRKPPQAGEKPKPPARR